MPIKITIGQSEAQQRSQSPLENSEMDDRQENEESVKFFYGDHKQTEGVANSLSIDPPTDSKDDYYQESVKDYWGNEGEVNL